MDIKALWEKMKATDVENIESEDEEEDSPPSPPEDWHSRIPNVSGMTN